MSGKGQLRPGWKLTLIILIYLALATTYSVVTPIGRGADEWAHYWYTQFISQNGRLPVNPAERETAGYKSDWPPLYHLLAAIATGWIETTGPPAFKYRPDALPGPGNIRRQLVPAQGAEAILHTEDELFPWRQEILIWHLGRFLSIGFGLGTLLVTYFTALELFAIYDLRFSPQALALISTAVLAFTPRFLFTGMVFGYDSLTLFLTSLFLWLALRVAKGRHRRWGFGGLGGLAGLALMAKYLAGLLPLEIILLAFAVPANGSPGKSAYRPGLDLPVHPFIRLGQAALAYTLVVGGWFAYLLVNFNEIKTYGPVLGILAPLLRGDGSDRTVDQLFAWFSGGQVPPPAHIEQQAYSAWQIIAELPLTFWGNPITRPYPLAWFVVIMTAISIMAVIGLLRFGFDDLCGLPASGKRATARLLTWLLLMHCAMPWPFMLVRLFGARDVLEAVQGRHILFLAGPALVVLLVLGGVRFAIYDLRFKICDLRLIIPSRFTFYGLLGLLLVGSISQLLYMSRIYPPLLPVRTTPYRLAQHTASLPFALTLPGGAKLIDYTIPYSSSVVTLQPSALPVSLIWQGGTDPAPADYQTELALIDSQGNTRSSWLAYQTQAHYPTRAWEQEDTIQDEGWLPLTGLAAGDYQVRLRLLDENGPFTDWQTLTTFTIDKTLKPEGDGAANWILWRNDGISALPPTLYERETVQFMLSQTPMDRSSTSSPPQLIGPDGGTYPPAVAGPTWANFIIGSAWPPGDYRLLPGDKVVLRVAPNERNFQMPVIAHPLDVNFDNQLKLLGYDLPTRRVQPGEGLPLTLYWQGLRWMDDDFVIFNRLLDNSQVARGGYDRRAKENYSTLLWAPGEIITDGFAMPVSPDAPAGIYTLSLGWYRKVKGQAESLPIVKGDNVSHSGEDSASHPVGDSASHPVGDSGQPTGETSVTIGPIKVGGPPPGATVAAAAPQTEVNIELGEQIKLLGYDSTPLALDSASPPVGDKGQLSITFYWQAISIPAADYTVFAHIRNDAGETVAQKDGPPAGGAYPTGLWDAGEIIKDEIKISLETLKPGRYDLVVGMYDWATGARLPVPGSPDNTIQLNSVEVGE